MNYDLTDDPISLVYKKYCLEIQLTSNENLIKAYSLLQNIKANDS